MLRVVRDPPEVHQQERHSSEKPQDDPRVIALLDRFTIDSEVPGKKYMFLPDDATVLTWGLRGQTFSDADLQEVEDWLAKNNPLDNKPGGTKESMRRLDTFVYEQLERVSNPSWLQDPLHRFSAQVRTAQRTLGADCNPRLLKAVFVAFLTIRA